MQFISNVISRLLSETALFPYDQSPLAQHARTNTRGPATADVSSFSMPFFEAVVTCQFCQQQADAGVPT